MDILNKINNKKSTGLKTQNHVLMDIDYLKSIIADKIERNIINKFKVSETCMYDEINSYSEFGYFIKFVDKKRRLRVNATVETSESWDTAGDDYIFNFRKINICSMKFF